MRAFLSLALTALVAFAPAQTMDIEGPVPFRPEERPLRGLTITIDAGHGGSAHDEGYSGSARGINSGVIEGDLNIQVASLLRHHLRRAGARVHMTRYDDRRVTPSGTDRATELGARVDVADGTESHLFLSLHHNSAPRRTANGVVVMIYPTDSAGNPQPLEVALADALREEVQELVPHTEEFPHLIQEHPLVVDSDIPSAIVEFGFLSNPEFDAWVSQGHPHIAEAEGVYNAIVRFWQEHQEEAEALHAQLFPRQERPRGDEDDPEDWTRDRMSRTARMYWPFDQPPQTAQQAQHIVEMYRMGTLTDRTFFHLDATVEGGPGGWRVEGSANHPMVREAIANILEGAGCRPLQNNIRQLPAASLGEERYGIVQIPNALTYGEPAIGPSIQTQLILGERVWLLDEATNDDGHFYLVMAGDSYIGWVREEAIKRMDAEAFVPWMLPHRAIVQREAWRDDLRIPMGTALPVVRQDGETITLALPRSYEATEGAAEVTLPRENIMLSGAEQFGEEVVEAAASLMATPYVFGARSGQGIDCSGLSGLAYQVNGLRLPRDTRQQIIVGELVGTPWLLGPLQPGDLIFFMDSTGRISHEAVSIGGMRFIHSATPQVHVASLDPNDPDYAADYAPRFAFARRPLM